MKAMKLYSGNEVYPLTCISNWSITSSLGGNKSMQFDIAPQSNLYKYIEEEGRIEYDGTYYSIKSINERRTAATITAEIDLDGLKEKMFKSFSHKTISLSEALDYALGGTDWACVGAGLVSAKRSFDLTDVTPLDIVNNCTNKTMYNVSFDVDNINKILNVSVPSTVAGNVYFTDRLNLKELTFKGSSNNLITRLYAYGKDGLSFAGQNGGKEYIDNNKYCKKIISQVWRDERYTNPVSLLADAKAKLAEMAVPERSYECSIIDLARLGKNEYKDFYIRLNSIVTLIDRRRKTRIEHTVVEIKEYPDDPVNNTVVISTAPQKLSRKINNNSAQISDVESAVNRQPSAWQKAIETATALITGADGGYVVLNPSEKPSEILIMNTDNINTATKVWRWNSGGLGYSANGYGGPYTTAVTMNGAIVADFITAGKINADLIRAGTLQGIKIIANTGSIAGWTMDGDVLVSKDKNIRLNGNTNTIQVYDDDGKPVAMLTKLGLYLYKDGKNVGKIGTNKLVDTDKYGLVFDLDPDGAYMTWAVYNKDTGLYDTKLYYDRDSGFKINGDISISGDIKDGNIVEGVSADGYKPVSGEFWAIKDMKTDSEGHVTSITTGTVKVRNGMVTAW